MRFVHELPHAASALHAAREQLELWCRMSGLDAEAILIVANELCTNAIQQGQGPVRLRAQSTARQVTVGVEQSIGKSPKRPHVLPASAWGTGGRGLRIVSAMAHSWGWHCDRRALTVWATLPLEPAA